MVMSDKIESDPPLSLYRAKRHVTLRVLSISGGWGVRRFFNQIGIHAGDEVRVLSRAPFGGPLVIESRGSRVAVGKQLAERIRVEVIQ